MAVLPDQARQWLDEPVFVTLATLNRDGAPHCTVHWVARDGDDILLSTVRGRLAAKNVERDPRVAVMLVGPSNPYSYLEVRATATVTEEGGRELIDALCKKYRNITPYPWDKPDTVRLVVRVPPERVVFHGR
jgi:PPOX class probable F420-dependent enzyme